MISLNHARNCSLLSISWMSFFWSTASIMVFSILPTFLSEVLGASKTKIGLIEGTAIFLAFVAKVFAGVLSDYWRSRKPLIIVGTFLSILSKIVFALASNILMIFVARSFDRFAKGVRSAPTDALIADLSPKHKEGSSYGLRYTLYMLGAVAGGGVATLIMYFSNNNYRLVFWLSAFPVCIALFILIKFVKPIIRTRENIPSSVWHWREIQFLPPLFWKILGVTFFLMLARFSEAFLTLRAKHLGWSIAALPLLMVTYDLVSAGIALPFGKLTDRFDRKKLLLLGIGILILANFFIIFINGPYSVMFGMLLAGLHMGMTQGLISTLIAQTTLSHLRGTAFALYYLTSGTAVLIGNSIAGYLSDLTQGTIGAFYGGAFFTTCAILYLIYVIKKNPDNNSHFKY